MPPASLLIKPVSGRCNLACAYCFYRDLAARRDLPDYGRMSLETAEALIAGALAYAEESCSFAFQGGEPTLAGLDFYRKFVRMARERNAKNLELRFMIQTNGMVIDREWADFLAGEKFLTGLSLDGPRALHDIFRLAPDGSGSFSRVMAAAQTLKEAGAEFNILCVVDSATADNALAVYEFFRRRGFTWLQYIPCLDPLDLSDRGDPSDRGEASDRATPSDTPATTETKTDPDAVSGAGRFSLTSAAWASFLKITFDAWHADIRAGRQVSVRYFDNLVDMALGYPPENCGMSGRCAAYFTIEADGSVFPCDFYVLDEWRMGNVMKDSFASVTASANALRFARVSEHVSPECVTCFAYPLCRGGCRRDREPFENGKPRLNRFCAAYKDFFAYAGQRILDLARELRGNARAGEGKKV